MSVFGVNWRQEARNYVGDVLILIPLGLTFVALAWLFFRALPQFEELDRLRIRDAYREIAMKVHSREIVSEDRVYDGRKSCGALSRGTWGFEVQGTRAFVWYREPRSLRMQGVELAAVKPFDIRTRAWVYGVVFLLAMLAVTDFGLRRYRALLRERGDFIRAVAHELNTPVATLRMKALRSGNGEFTALAERMGRMVRNLNDFMNMGGRRPEPRCESLDLVALAREAYSAFSRDFERYSPVEFSGADSLSAVGDGDLVMQVLWNLFGNEAKYAAPYGKVSVTFRSEGSFAIVEFTDEGPGLTAHERRRIFDSCYRARSALESGKGGFGLGLCTSRQFARMMNGSLTVRPHGRGSCFAFSLRRVRAC